MAYRILTLDGGGSWALIEVMALRALYSDQKSGHDVLADFDLVAANSGGSLVLGGLVENLTLGALLSYFQNQQNRESIFSPTTSWGDRALRDLTGMGPKYSAANKLQAIQGFLPTRGTSPLTSAAAGVRRTGASADIHLLITGFDYDRNRATFFRSAPASGAAWGTGDAASVTLAEALHASTNAPVNYFDGPAQFPDRPGRYWDGAIAGCNNPVLAAVAEALALGQNPMDIVALSLGTGSVALPPLPSGAASSPYLRPPADTGLVADLHKLATSILDDPPDIASYLAYAMTGASKGLKDPIKSRIVRMNPLISPVQGAAGIWTAPGGMTAAQFTYLANMDMDAIQQSQVNAIAAYADLWLKSQAPNQPIRMNTDTLACELGDAWFQAASAAWAAIK